MPRLPLFVLSAALLISGCAGLDAASTDDLDRAAVDLGAQLDAPGLLAATTLLYHETNGRYPATPFELLGSTAARETGLQDLGLSALDLSTASDGLTLTYTLLPSPADPSERFGTITISETDADGTYDVGLLLERIADPDLASRSLPLAREGQYAVVRARGTLCAEVATVRERLRSGEAVGAPPLEAGRSYTITFTSPTGAAAELREGYTVTLPR
jgi:hypothetical protein